jgi:hypothetical protein
VLIVSRRWFRARGWRRHIAAPKELTRLIQLSSAWKVNSANVACTEFSEVRMALGGYGRTSDGHTARLVVAKIVRVSA